MCPERSSRPAQICAMSATYRICVRCASVCVHSSAVGASKSTHAPCLLYTCKPCCGCCLQQGAAVWLHSSKAALQPCAAARSRWPVFFPMSANVLMGNSCIGFHVVVGVLRAAARVPLDLRTFEVATAAAHSAAKRCADPVAQLEVAKRPVECASRCDRKRFHVVVRHINDHQLAVCYQPRPSQSAVRVDRLQHDTESTVLRSAIKRQTATQRRSLSRGPPGHACQLRV